MRCLLLTRSLVRSCSLSFPSFFNLFSHININIKKSLILINFLSFLLSAPSFLLNPPLPFSFISFSFVFDFNRQFYLSFFLSSFFFSFYFCCCSCCCCYSVVMLLKRREHFRCLNGHCDCGIIQKYR